MWTRFMRSVQRANQVLRTEGLCTFVTKVLRHVMRLVYTNDTYFIFEHTLEHTDFGDFLPKGIEADLKIICSPQDLASLVAEGYDLSRLDLSRARRYLSNQGILSCIFIQHRVASQLWASMNSKTDFDPIARQFDYQAGALLGVSYTWPEYRKLGLYKYGMAQTCKALKAKGVRKAMATVAPDIKAAIKVVNELGFRQVGKGQLVQFFFWSDWQAHNKTRQNHRRGSGHQ